MNTGLTAAAMKALKYFRHAGLTLFGAIEVLNIVSDNAFSSLYEEEKIREIFPPIFFMFT